ncbi:sodium- and chloride-dependent transporter XTRP3 isoform X1 [Cotesia glomerata]|uniref:sodium- and chloride-dependent transporter XTRP3 isoform X1 n=1 Tax=Cotesia glomerata TaxID=32391 RepID=UPI001D03227C|nr:sodium- and chloride-dependent transporter XTRP3 isoform X1 [Cotesia glomerata]XP_044599320.1 sodium- and chloride-dependent transporter XTRP3 isoform X1 [Cotesia glomerata]
MSETTRRNSFEAPSKTKTTTMELNNHDSNENLENKRTAWSGKLQFFMSIISYSVGLGNIWRFPYLCHQNGGGAFLVSYFIMLILEGIPIFLIELGIGQRLRQGAFGVWNTIHPCLGGIGISSCIVTFFVALYYNIIIAWCFFYFFSSLRAVGRIFTLNLNKSIESTLAWTDCPKNTTTDDYIEECSKSSSTAYYWYRVTLDASPSIEQGMELKWWIVLCLLMSWIIVFFIVMKGIQSSGKVIYFISTFPYIVLTVFFIRGITLKGAIIGLQHMFTPQIGKLLDPRMWLDAAVQVFFSFGSAFGSLIAFGSYNPTDNNCVRDVILVSICNGFTAIYASIVVFTILGFKAVSNVEKCLQSNRILLQLHGLLSDVNDPEEKYQNAVDFYSHSLVPMNFTLKQCSVSEQLNQAAEGTGLAFIVFTQAIVELPSAPFWSCIFFLMLLTLGLGTQIGLLEGMLCVVFEINFFKKIKKPYLTGVICTICFFIGLIFCTGAGEYWLEFFDNFASTIGLVLIALMEVIAVAYVYGYEKFSKDIEFMTGYKPGFYWKITWRFLAPIFITVVLISSIVSMLIIKPKYSTWDPSLGRKITTEYPNWVLIIGICMIFVGIAPIPIVFLLKKYKCFRVNMNTHQKNIYWVNTTESTKEPVLDENRASLENFPEDNKDSNNQDINHICNNLHKNITPKEIQGKSFKMEVFDY